MSSVKSLRNGEWYQDIYGWSRMLDFDSACGPVSVRLEATDALHVDDVVVTYGQDRPVEYVQLKFHVGGEASSYSVASFTALPKGAKKPKPGAKPSRSKSLLQKFWTSWLSLRDNPSGVRLILFSNWSWDSSDPLRKLISGVHDRLDETFFTAPSDSPIGVARETWRKHLAANEEDFEAFIRAMHFRVGQGGILQSMESAAQRMADRCLRSDEHALDAAVGQVGKWIRDGVEVVTPEMYKGAITDLNLRLPDADPAIRVCMHTIERQAYPESADHVLDWCKHFLPATESALFPRGRAVADSSVWNKAFLPELLELKSQLNAAPIRLLRARGQARLSVWTAFGHVFDGRSRYIIEVDQNGQIWRSDAVPAPGVTAIAPEGAEALGLGPDVAIGVSITNRVGPAVREAIATLELPIHTLINLEPSTGVGRNAIKSAGDLTAFVEGVRQELSDVVSRTRARRVHLFYSGPLSGAAFLGHAIGASAPELQLYEDAQPGYSPTFRLTA